MKINMYDERLIESVRKHSVPYADTEIVYRNVMRTRKVAWHQVAEDTGSAGIRFLGQLCIQFMDCSDDRAADEWQ